MRVTLYVLVLRGLILNPGHLVGTNQSQVFSLKKPKSYRHENKVKNFLKVIFVSGYYQQIPLRDQNQQLIYPYKYVRCSHRLIERIPLCHRTPLSSKDNCMYNLLHMCKAEAKEYFQFKK